MNLFFLFFLFLQYSTNLIKMDIHNINVRFMIYTFVRYFLFFRILFENTIVQSIAWSKIYSLFLFLNITKEIWNFHLKEYKSSFCCNFFLSHLAVTFVLKLLLYHQCKVPDHKMGHQSECKSRSTKERILVQLSVNCCTNEGISNAATLTDCTKAYKKSVKDLIKCKKSL